MVDHVAGAQQPASSPSQADEALRRVRPPYVPPLDIAQRGARDVLDQAARLWPDIGIAPASLLAYHLGALDAALRHLADAVDADLYGQDAA